jgi:hypothetical protein
LAELAPPSNELAARILTPVSFEQRLVGVRMTPMAGNVEQPIVSISEAAAFLQMASLEQVIAAGPRASVPYIDPKALQAWVLDALDDQELSKAIEEEVAKGTNYREQADSTRELLKLRVEQAKAILETDEPA